MRASGYLCALFVWSGRPGFPTRPVGFQGLRAAPGVSHFCCLPSGLLTPRGGGGIPSLLGCGRFRPCWVGGLALGCGSVDKTRTPSPIPTTMTYSSQASKQDNGRCMVRRSAWLNSPSFQEGCGDVERNFPCIVWGGHSVFIEVENSS